MSRRKNSRSRGGNGRHGGRGGRKIFPQVTGKVQMTREGFAFVIPEGDEDDVFVKASKTRGALNGDIVLVTVTREKTDTTRREGEIVEIIERSRKPFIGILHIVGNQAWVLMQSRFMPYDISVPYTDELGRCTGMKVAAVVDGWKKGATIPHGHVIDILGEPGENDTEMHAILAEYALPYKFEPEVENAADHISEEITEDDIKGRRDFRNILTFTIDPADAKDFDDALSIQKLEDGIWEVGVHIADVTHYVRPDSVVDCEAQERGTSVYLVDRTVPMLPERLCNELCSLRPNEEKLSFSAVFKLNEEGEVLDEWFGRTVILSDRRFTYAEAQARIETGVGDYAEEIAVLNDMAQKMRARRFKSGAVSFERAEFKFILDDNGKPLGVYTKEQKEANQLIEEFMLLANRRVAEYCTYRIVNGKKVQRPMVYRVHDEPNEEKLTRFRDFVLRFGYQFKASKGRSVAKAINKLVTEVKGRPEENAIQSLAVRSMSKAFYTTDNVGHYGLAFKYYAHFTSPIRRYPDMIAHRLLAR